MKTETTLWYIDKLKEYSKDLLLKIHHLEGISDYRNGVDVDYVIGYLWDAVYEIDEIVKENEKKV